MPNDFRYRFSWAPRGVLTALLTPARLIDGGTETEVLHVWDAVRPLVVNSESFEVYPNRDSIPFVRIYNLPDAWKIDKFERGTMRLEDWSAAWKPVFDELPTASDLHINELAAQLAKRYPTTASDHDRVVMSVKLEAQMDDGDFWTGEYVLDSVGTKYEAATPRMVSVPLACGVLEVAAGRVPPGLQQATGDHEAVERWLAYLATQGIIPKYTSSH